MCENHVFSAPDGQLIGNKGREDSRQMREEDRQADEGRGWGDTQEKRMDRQMGEDAGVCWG